VSNTGFINELEGIIQSRLADGSDDSYTVQLAAAGTKRCAQKVGEEATELALAAVAGDREELLNEAADLLYHYLVLLNVEGVSLSDIAQRLQSRHVV